MHAIQCRSSSPVHVSVAKYYRSLAATHTSCTGLGTWTFSPELAADLQRTEKPICHPAIAMDRRRGPAYLSRSEEASKKGAQLYHPLKSLDLHFTGE